MMGSFVTESDLFVEKLTRAVAEKNGDSYSPIYVQGDPYDVGALMHRFENEFTKQNPQSQVCRIKGNNFYNQYIKTSFKVKLDAIASVMSACDMLIFENFDAIAGNPELLQMFTLLFDNLCRAGNKIIIGGFIPVRLSPYLASRIRTQLECGIVCNIAG